MMLSRFRAALDAFANPPQVRSIQWDAARPVKRLPEWTAQPSSPNTHFDNPIWLRGRSEGAYRNDAAARKAVDAIVNAAIGATGLNPQFADRAVQAEWETWSGDCDASGRLDWAGIEALLLQTVAVSGEAFALLVIDERAEGVPLRLQVLGPEYLDTSKTGGSTYAGIEYSGLRPTAYWMFAQTPGSVMTSLWSVRVPAAQCLHIFRPVAPGAQRGQSWLAPVLIALRELQEYLEAALVRQKTAALFCGVIRTRDGSNPLNPTDSATPSMEPGAMVRLQSFEDEVTFTDPPDVGSMFDPFVRAQLRRIAAGVGTPYEILSGDLSGVTFASGRHGLLDFKRSIEAIQYSLVVQQFCAPVLKTWLRMAQALGTIQGDGGRVRWIGPTIEMLDPRADTLATINRVRAGRYPRAGARQRPQKSVAARPDPTARDAGEPIMAPNHEYQRFSDPRRTAWSMIHKLVKVIEEVPAEDRGQLDDVFMTLEKFAGQRPARRNGGNYAD